MAKRIMLKDQKTGIAKDYPVAQFDLAKWREDATSADAIFDMVLDEGAVNSLGVVRWDDLSDADKKGIGFSCSNIMQGVDLTNYLSDAIAPTSPRNLLYIQPGTSWASLFTPALNGSGSSYPLGSQPSDWGVNNEWGYWWRDYGQPGGLDYHTVGATDSYMSGANPIPIYKNEKATKLFQTTNGSIFGITSFTGFRFYSGSGHIVCATCIGTKGFAVEDNVPSGSAAYNARYNSYWVLQSGDTTASNGGRYHIGGGTYPSTWAERELDSYDENSPCSTEFFSTQIVEIVDGTTKYYGACAIDWRNGRPYSISSLCYPSWAWGGVEGEFEPVDPTEPGDIPDMNPEFGNGTWTIINNPPGTATIPSGSPLSGVGVNDAGLHLFILKQSAMTKLTEKAWTSDQKQLDALMSGIISSGFIPKAFTDLAKGNKSPESKIRIGTTDVPNLLTNPGEAWLINDHIWVQKLRVAHFDLTDRLYENYLDFEPYTSVTLTIPFCGDIQIPASMCIGGTIQVDMNCNLTNGDVVATIRCNAGKFTVDSFTNTIAAENCLYARGNCLSKFPVIGMSNGMSQYLSSGMQIVGGIINTAGSLSTGNIAGAITGGMGIASGVHGAMNAKHQPVVNGAPIGSVSLIDNKKFILTIKTVASTESNDFIAYHPYQANLAKKKISQYKGNYINGKWSKLCVSDIEFYTVASAGMTGAEQERIKSLLREGVLV